MLDGNHYLGLVAGYSIATAGAVAALKLRPIWWSSSDGFRFPNAWREFGYAMLAVVGVIVVGQLYQRGLRFQAAEPWSVAAEIANQVLIFSPMVVLLIVRRHSPATAWLPARAAGFQILLGLGLAILAIIAFSVIVERTTAWHVVLTRVASLIHADKFAQVFLEDFSIALLLVRLGAALRKPIVATVVVAFLFAAGHIPAMLSRGADMSELSRLILDFGLAAMVLLTLQRTASIWWFAWVHFAMDMMQFEQVTRSGPAT